MKKYLLLFLLPSFFLLFLVLTLSFYRFLTVPTKVEVIQNLKKTLNSEVYTAFAAQQLLITGGAEDILPLTGPSHSWTVFCQENREFLVYKTDRYGFHNNDALWDIPQWQAAFVGDSFVQGACVNSEKNFVRVYETQHGTSANLGSYGNGPLTQLASLIEYATAYRPKKVFWIYMQNDLFMDLSLESENEILKNYLMGQSQNLMKRQKVIDLKLKSYLKASEALQQPPTWKFLFRAESFDFLAPVRPHPQSDLFHQREVNWKLYAEVINKAVEVTHSWNGEFYFVILPSADMLIEENQKESRSLQSQLSILAKRSGASVLDLQEKFQTLHDPLSYYERLPGRYGHFTPQGYQMVEKFLSTK